MNADVVGRGIDVDLQVLRRDAGGNKGKWQRIDIWMMCRSA